MVYCSINALSGWFNELEGKGQENKMTASVFFLDSTFCRKGLTPWGVTILAYIIPHGLSASLHAPCYLICSLSNWFSYQGLLRIYNIKRKYPSVTWDTIAVKSFQSPPVALILMIHIPLQCDQKELQVEFTHLEWQSSFHSCLALSWKLNEHTLIPQFPSLSEQASLFELCVYLAASISSFCPHCRWLPWLCRAQRLSSCLKTSSLRLQTVKAFRLLLLPNGMCSCAGRFPRSWLMSRRPCCWAGFHPIVLIWLLHHWTETRKKHNCLHYFVHWKVNYLTIHKNKYNLTVERVWNNKKYLVRNSHCLYLKN